MIEVVKLLLIFFLGAIAGWVVELFFRRFVSSKKWVNPGFLQGPYLPLYGFGLVFLYGICSIDLSFLHVQEIYEILIKMVLISVSLTLVEYIAGLIFIKECRSNCGIIPSNGAIFRASSALYSVSSGR